MPDRPVRRGRRESSLDPAAPSALRELAQALRDLRAECGGPAYRRLGELSHTAASTLSEAAAGRRAPTWETTRAYVTGCLRHAGRDPAPHLPEWRRRWEQAAATPAEAPEPTPDSPAFPVAPAVPAAAASPASPAFPAFPNSPDGEAPAPGGEPLPHGEPSPGDAPSTPANSPEPRRRWAVAVVAALAILLVGTLTGSAPRPPRPMTGLFNVLLTPYAWIGPDPGSDVAGRWQSVIARELRGWAGGTASVEVRGPAGVPATRRTDLAELAVAHRADVVIRPVFRATGGLLTVTVETYVGDRTLGEAPEFAGRHDLAVTEPLDVAEASLRPGEELAASTRGYLQAVVAFVRGLGDYSAGDLAAAERQFRIATGAFDEVVREPGTHRLRREVVHLMLGNTLGASGKVDEAADEFRAALAENPGYKRAMAGLAETIRVSVTCTPDERDPERLTVAIGYYQRALSPGGPPVLEMKTRLGLGMAYQCQRLTGVESAWDAADAAYAEVLRLQATTPLRAGSARLAKWYAAEARAGQAVTALTYGRDEEAARAYEEALTFLAGIDRPRPVQWERAVVLLGNLRDTYARLGRTDAESRTRQRLERAERDLRAAIPGA